MNIKIAGLILTSILILGMVSTATWAYFVDNEDTADNLLTAGTLDLKINDLDGVTAVLGAPRLKPNTGTGPVIVALHNAGLANASALDITFSYLESDGLQNNTQNMSADAMAEVIEITALAYGSTDLLAAVPDFNNNTYKDMQDLKNADLTAQAGLGADEYKDFIVAIKMRDGIVNDFQGDGIDINIKFTLRQ